VKLLAAQKLDWEHSDSYYRDLRSYVTIVRTLESGCKRRLDGRNEKCTGGLSKFHKTA